MLVVQETTIWKNNTPNHIYFLTDDRSKMLGYIADDGKEKVFKAPIEFSTNGRTFNILRKVDEQQQGIAVKGSKGDVYYVTKHGSEYKCTCVGFKYHGTCKHIEKVKDD